MIIIGHFRVPPGPPYQNEVKCSAPALWRWFLILMQIKLIFRRKVMDLASLKVRAYGTRKWSITLDKVWKKGMKWYWRLFMAIFKDFYSGSKKSIHDCTVTSSFSPHPWFTTLHKLIRAAYLNLLLLNLYPYREFINALKLLTIIIFMWLIFGRSLEGTV